MHCVYYSIIEYDGSKLAFGGYTKGSASHYSRHVPLNNNENDAALLGLGSYRIFGRLGAASRSGT